MRSHTTKRPRNRELRQWSTPSTFLAGVALFIALGGSAVAANSLIHAGNIAPGAVTSQAIRNGGVRPEDLSTKTRALLHAAEGVASEKGDTGSTGAPGTNGANGPNGANGTNGTDGTNGTNGTNGANGPNGANGIDGTDGTDGIDGTNGTDGIDGTIAPLSATSGLTALPTASPPTTVIALAVPAGNYVVLAKTQLSHTGAGDTVDCVLKAGATSIDRVSMKTLPALAAIPVSLQAVTVTTSPSQLSVECDVLTANGSADFSSLIAIPTG
jgi:Collagen triple helix repeat (20 copies)